MNTAGQRRVLRRRPGSGSTLEAVAALVAVPDWTKFANWRWVMRKRTRGWLVTAIIAAGLVGGLAWGNPSALADPELPPPPAPIDPAAAAAPPVDPIAPPPPVDPMAPPPVDPVAFPPPAPVDPVVPPTPADPLAQPAPGSPFAAAQPTVI